jgi:nucleoside-triphosphatase THEP1
MPDKRKKRAQVKIGKYVVTVSPGECVEKDKIDKHAKKALDEIGGIVTANKKLKMRLNAAKEHLKAIMSDHHHL